MGHPWFCITAALILKLFALEDYYNLDRGVITKAIRRVRQERFNLMVGIFSPRVFKRIAAGIGKKWSYFPLKPKNRTSAGLFKPPPAGYLEFMAINRKIFRSDVVDIASVSPGKLAYRELEFLNQKGLIKRKGKGSTSHYVLAEKL